MSSFQLSANLQELDAELQELCDVARHRKDVEGGMNVQMQASIDVHVSQVRIATPFDICVPKLLR